MLQLVRSALAVIVPMPMTLRVFVNVSSRGFDDAVIAEVVAGVALEIFTNYFNLVADTEVDFPRATSLKPKPAAAF